MIQRIGIFFSLLFFVVLLSVIGQLSEYRTRSLISQQSSITIKIEPGSSVRKILKDLTLDPRVQPFSPFWFEVFIRLQGASTQIKAGEYRITQGMTGQQWVKKIVAGDVTQYAITLIPGWTFAQALNHIQQHPALETTLVPATLDLVQTLKLHEPSLEGLLFPETYFFPKGISDKQIILRAYRMMQLNAVKACPQPNALLKSIYRTLILASIIEKESSHPNELKKISQVFHNRLKKGMPLQADPTVIYGIKDFNGNITKKDLTTPSPYNTYLNYGLPPTPIALPSFAAIDAACHPSEGDYLYFVAKSDGHHHFSKTYEEHIKMVKRYQLGES